MSRTEYAVVVISGAVGFPAGEWSRFLYRHLADRGVADLARVGVVAHVVAHRAHDRPDDHEGMWTF